MYNLENHDEALSNTISALELYDIYNSPYEIGLLYLRIRNIFIHKMQFDLADLYLNKAERIFRDLGNEYMMRCFFIIKSKMYYNKGDILSSEKELQKSAKYSQSEFATELHRFDLFEGQGRVAIMKGDDMTAIKYFEKASYVIGKTHSDRRLIPQAFIKYIKSKNDFQNVIVGDKCTTINRGESKNTFYKYMDGTTQYLNGNNVGYRKQGENILKEIVLESRQPLAAYAAKYTLENKLLYTLR